MLRSLLTIIIISFVFFLFEIFMGLSTIVFYLHQYILHVTELCKN